MSDLRYPIGKFTFDGAPTEQARNKFIDDIELAPSRLRAAVQGLSQEQLDTPYRPGGWTVRQVVHHVPDSHLNAYVRFKLALTEDEPTIKPYFMRIAGRNCRNPGRPPLKFRWRCWNLSTNDGCWCCVLLRRRTGSARSGILS